jgi:hypothetical protein
MPNNDDGLIDPTPKRPESGSAESDPYAAFLFVFLALFIAVGVLFAAVRGHPVGTPILAMVGYTILVGLIAFKFRVPWDRLTRGKFLLAHCLVLAIVYAIGPGRWQPTRISQRGSLLEEDPPSGCASSSSLLSWLFVSIPGC